jgi:hypothetical protein
MNNEIKGLRYLQNNPIYKNTNLLATLVNQAGIMGIDTAGVQRIAQQFGQSVNLQDARKFMRYIQPMARNPLMDVLQEVANFSKPLRNKPLGQPGDEQVISRQDIERVLQHRQANS